MFLNSNKFLSYTIRFVWRHSSGEFYLEVNCNSLSEDNKAGFFYTISGSTTELSVAFYNGDERFDKFNSTNVYVSKEVPVITVNPINKKRVE
jgi:hypothetical protein